MSGSILILALAAVLAVMIGVILWIRLWRRSDVGDDLYPELASWSMLQPSNKSDSKSSLESMVAMSGLLVHNGSGDPGGSSRGDGTIGSQP